MEVRPIRTEADDDAALREIEACFDRVPEPGSPEADRFDVLAALIGAYEQKHWAVEPPVDGIEAVLDVMSWRGLAQTDLAALLGSRSRASEILNRQRGLTSDQIRVLHEEWHIPAELLIAAPQTRRSGRDARRARGEPLPADR